MLPFQSENVTRLNNYNFSFILGSTFECQNRPLTIDLIKGQMRNRGRNSSLVSRSGAEKRGPQTIETSTRGTG